MAEAIFNSLADGRHIAKSAGSKPADRVNPVAVEALKDFARTRRGGADDLARFARACRVSRVMQPYLDAIA